jgi:hypothetical protein
MQMILSIFIDEPKHFIGLFSQKDVELKFFIKILDWNFY